MSVADVFAKIFSIKYGALVLLVLQNTFLVVFMHYSRLGDGPMYASSTAVVVMEVIKFVTCLGVVAYDKGGIIGLFTCLRGEVFVQPRELALLAVPSLLYTVQNNLLYFALSHLDAATYQVGYQSKILTTAIFSVLMLGKRISPMQWLSLVILTLGVCLAQLSASKTNNNQANTTAGFIAVLLASCTSGFAGVFFEKVLKTSGTSLWVRNIQMGFTSILLGFAGIYFSGDSDSVLQNGFFYGYNNIVIMVILLQAIGGLVVAVVVKYADNILKGFAASFSIVTSCILSYLAFDFHPSWIFVLGAVLVNVSMYMYTLEPGRADKPTVGVSADDTAAGSSTAAGAGVRRYANISAMERGATTTTAGLASLSQDPGADDGGGNTDHEN